MSQLDHQMKREKIRLEAMMEHLYPKTVKISTSETNNNNSKTNITSSKIAINEIAKEYKTSEHTIDNGRKENDLSEEDTNHMTKPKISEMKAVSSNDDGPSSLISPQERKISRKECTNSLKPLILDENNVIQPRISKRETPAFRENFVESNNKDDILSLEEKMQRERARILGGYSNSLGNAQRVRDDQVFSQSYTNMEYQSCIS